MIEWIMTHAPDDAFLYLQLITGKTSILETNGYQPLWAIVLAPFGQLFEGETLMYVALALYYLILLAIPFVVHRLYKTWWGLLVWCIPALLSGYLMMELTLAVLVIFIAFHYKKPSLSVLMIYARLDLFPLALMITPIRKWWRLLVYYSPWLIFQLVVFQTIIPDPVRAMYYTASGPVESGIRLMWPPTGYQLALFHYLEIHYVWPLMIVGAIGCAISHKYRPILYQFIFLIVIDLIRGYPAFMWHFTIIPVLIALGTKNLYTTLPQLVKHARLPTITLGTKAWNFAPLRASDIKAGVTVLLLIIVMLTIPYTYNLITQPIWPWHPVLYESRNIVVDGTRGALNSGIQGFFSPQKVYNLDGFFCHDVPVVDYIADYEQYIPDGYELVENYQETVLGWFGLYKRVYEDD